MGYKTIDGLMRHLRENGIIISGSTQKRKLINTGYFHGYKGYRFFINSQNKIPFKTYDEIYATIQYDSKLKSLFYGKIMFIETAIKNITLESILNNARSESLQDMYDKVVSSYKNSPEDFSIDTKKRLQQNKLNLQNSIQNNLAKAYRSNNTKITHFYNNTNYEDIPIWALFEIITMGDLGYLLSCLTFEVRNDISKKLGFDISYDTDRQLVYKYVYTLKDLRNAIAHNAVIFDTRFRNIDPKKEMKKFLEYKIGLPYVNFKTIGDYVILMCYYLKVLYLSKIEIKAFIREFENIIDNYTKSVNKDVCKMVIHPDLKSRMDLLKKFI